MAMLQNLTQKIGLFAPNLWKQTIRHRGKFRTYMPKPRHDLLRYMEELTRPILPKQVPNILERCKENKMLIKAKYKATTESAGEFERFLAKYANRMINEHEAMIICHRHYCSKDLIRRNKIVFKKDEITLWDFNSVVMRLFIEQNLKYTNLLPIVNTGLGRNIYLFVKKEDKIPSLLTHLRKMPHLVMLGGLINNRLYTRNGVLEYTKLNDLQTLRGELCGILMNNLATSAGTFMSPIEALSFTLKQIVDLKK